MTGKALNHQRFYCPCDGVTGDLIEFSSEESLHMVGSLRLRSGESITSTDGAGRVYEIVIEEARKRKVIGRITDVKQIPQDRPGISLFQGIIKPSHMEIALEKCAELGISAFVPVVCGFSVGGLGRGRFERLRRIAVQAMKQSLGAYLADVGEAVVFKDALDLSSRCDLQLVACQGAHHRSLAELVRQRRADEVALWIGPEGGFAGDEIEALISGGARAFSMGDHRLRAETAAISAVAVIRGLTLSPAPRRSCCEDTGEHSNP